mmetsp:Transcript_58907/g.140591  ORF Transcript_58907/g.140591 Transcript_58907/m.140591 type:complete len:385 (+) Transcript_58907:117-1271(+)
MVPSAAARLLVLLVVAATALRPKDAYEEEIQHREASKQLLVAAPVSESALESEPFEPTVASLHPARMRFPAASLMSLSGEDGPKPDKDAPDLTEMKKWATALKDSTWAKPETYTGWQAKIAGLAEADTGFRSIKQLFTVVHYVGWAAIYEQLGELALIAQEMQGLLATLASKTDDSGVPALVKEVFYKYWAAHFMRYPDKPERSLVDHRPRMPSVYYTDPFTLQPRGKMLQPVLAILDHAEAAVERTYQRSEYAKFFKNSKLSETAAKKHEDAPMEDQFDDPAILMSMLLFDVAVEYPALQNEVAPCPVAELFVYGYPNDEDVRLNEMQVPLWLRMDESPVIETAGAPEDAMVKLWYVDWYNMMWVYHVELQHVPAMAGRVWYH